VTGQGENLKSQHHHLYGGAACICAGSVARTARFPLFFAGFQAPLRVKFGFSEQRILTAGSNFLAFHLITDKGKGADNSANSFFGIDASKTRYVPAGNSIHSHLRSGPASLVAGQ